MRSAAVKLASEVLASLTATAAMSALMVTSERLGVMRGQPPRMIIDRIAPRLDDGSATIVTTLAHTAYGVATGVLFARLMTHRRASALLGAAYGVVVWTIGYEGWVPALRVLPPAHRDQRGRVVTMVAAHLIYGSVLGRLVARLPQEEVR